MSQESCLSLLDLPDSLLLQVFTSLPLHSLRCLSLTCTRLHRIAQDELLWKTLFQRDFGVDKSAALRPQGSSWQAEYRRLHDQSPAVLCQELLAHSDEVWHVAFSQDGSMFATTSLDGAVKVWQASTPCTMRFSADPKARFGWNNTQFSQFNSSDTLLLVSGYRGRFGEIVVFDLKGEFRVVNRVSMTPYTVFGTWLDDSHLLTATKPIHSRLGPVSCLWLAKATRKVESKRRYAMMNPFRFRGCKQLKVADVPVDDDTPRPGCDGPLECGQTFHSHKALTPASQCAHHRSPREVFAPASRHGHDGRVTLASEYEHDEELTLARENGRARSSDVELTLASECRGPDASSNEASLLARVCCPCFHLSADSTETLSAKRKEDPTTANTGSLSGPSEPHLPNPQIRHASPPTLTGAAEPPAQPRVEKLLIFTQGDICDIPQYVSIKRVREEEVEEEERATEGLQWPGKEDECLRNDSVGGSGCMTSVDHTFNMHGQIIGMALSPDHRYLYVNTRSWPADYETYDVGELPPISNDITIHVIDLVTFTRLDTVLTSHKAFTPNYRCAFIFLDVNDLYVVSGAEDSQGYLWDRHYGVHVRCFPHDNCVSCCAFNPADPQMLVTVSDDHKIKIWRSRRQMRESPSLRGWH